MRRLVAPTIALFTAALLIAAALAPHATTAASASPFFLFATSKFQAGERQAVLGALQQYATSADYLSVRLGQESPELATRVGRAHLFALPPSLNALSRQVADCSASSPGLIIYDGEHWQDTPIDEQSDMPGAVARGKGIVSSSGCHAFGIAPDGEFAGLQPKTCSADVSAGIHRRIDWGNIALFNIQAQRLLSDQCAGQAGIDPYVTFVTAVANEVRAKNSQTQISAQFSFRFTPPDRMIAAIGRLRGVVDGFYIAYPSNMQTPCQYCSPANLARVLGAIRQP